MVHNDSYWKNYNIPEWLPKGKLLSIAKNTQKQGIDLALLLSNYLNYSTYKCEILGTFINKNLNKFMHVKLELIGKTEE